MNLPGPQGRSKVSCIYKRRQQDGGYRAGTDNRSAWAQELHILIMEGDRK